MVFERRTAADARGAIVVDNDSASAIAIARDVDDDDGRIYRGIGEAGVGLLCCGFRSAGWRLPSGLGLGVVVVSSQQEQ